MNIFKKVVAFVVVLPLMIGLFTAPALAYGGYDRGHRGGGNDIEVTNNNSATVSNTVTVDADTGHNNANGGDGGDGDNGGDGGDNDGHDGDGGDGGDANGDGDGGDGGDGGDTGKGGAGGDGGDGGIGGIIMTGDATARANVSNDVNSNRTVIEGCGCEDNGHEGMWWMPRKHKGDKGGDVVVRNNNRNTYVTNNVDVDADTGNNDANGGDGGDGYNGGDGGDEAGNGGDGGDAGDDDDNNYHRHHYYQHHWNHGDDDDDGDGGDGGDGGDTGNGGAGGDGGNGGGDGRVTTGDAVASATVANVVNRNVTRIQR